MVVEAAHDILDGRRDHTVGTPVPRRLALDRTLIGAGILAGIGITIGLILLIAPGLFLLTIWALIVPVIVSSAWRDRVLRPQPALVRGHGWPVLGVLVCCCRSRSCSGACSRDLIAFADNVGYAVADLMTSGWSRRSPRLAAAVLYFELKRIRGEPAAAAPAGPPAGPACPARPQPPADAGPRGRPPEGRRARGVR